MALCALRIAFANRLGGTIYVGVEDDGTLQGEAALCAAYRTNPEKARAALVPHFQALIVENVKPVPNFKIDVVEVKQQPVLVIRVGGGSRRPYSYKTHPVILNHETHQRIAAYAKATGKTICSSVDEAINEWMDTNGEPMMNFVERQKLKNQAGHAAFWSLMQKGNAESWGQIVLT